MIALNFDIGILHDLFPARNFPAKNSRELVGGAAERIDTDRRNLTGKLRIFERAPDFEIKLLHDVFGRALGGDDSDPCGEVKARQS